MLSEKIVAEVLDELHGRKGIGDELDQLKNSDEETYGELRDTLKTRVSHTLTREHQAAQNSERPASPPDAPAEGGHPHA